jgi:type I restriction enzyme S subunit
MAQALFKSWFVDFDPVIAKAEGRAPFGMSAELAAMFPAEFVETKLGAVPKGWNVDKVSSICTTQYGYTASASDEPIGPKFLRITDINKEPWIEWNDVPYCQVTETNKDKYLLNIGDILVSRMADPGKAGIVEQDIDAVFASYLVRLKAKNLTYSYYLFYFLCSDQYLDYADGVMSGSVQLGMNAKVIVDADMVLPPESLVDKFYEQVQSLRKKIVSNLQESNTLASIRDTLLPRLLSGEVRAKGLTE